MTVLVEGDEFKIYVETGLTGEAIGFDSVILALPPSCGVMSGPGKVMLDIKRLTKVVEMVAMASAENLGETLRNAEFVVTFDPRVITERGLMHDCEVCRAGVARALAMLEEEEIPMVVGQMYWAAPPGEADGS